MSWNTTRFTHFKQCKPVFKAVIFFLYNVCFYFACTKKVDFHYTVTNKFSQLCKCKRFNFNSIFLMLTVFAYTFVYRDMMYGFGSDFFWQVFHCSITVTYLVKPPLILFMIRRGIYHQALNDIIVLTWCSHCFGR